MKSLNHFNINSIVIKKNDDLLNSFSEKFNLWDSVVFKIMILHPKRDHRPEEPLLPFRDDFC